MRRLLLFIIVTLLWGGATAQERTKHDWVRDGIYIPEVAV